MKNLHVCELGTTLSERPYTGDTRELSIANEGTSIADSEGEYTAVIDDFGELK